MRLARKLMLLALMAIAAAALTPLSAAGQTEPLMHNQAPQLLVDNEIPGDDVPCLDDITPTPAPNPGPLVTSGGCRVHVATTVAGMTQVVHLDNGMELPISTCNVEFDLRIDRNGEGYASHQELTGDAGTCTQKACGQVTPPTSEGRAWSYYLREFPPSSPPTERMIILFCFQSLMGGNPVHCEITFPVTQPMAHRYRFSATNLAGHGSVTPRCEITGTFDVEAVPATTGEGQSEQQIELRHT